MAATPTKIITDLQPDDALNQNSVTRFDRTDRQYIDTQILGCQQHLATSLINGVHATYVKVDAGSATLAKGDVVCLAGSSLGYATVTLATPAALSAAGSAYGVVLLAASPGSYALIAVSGLVSPSVTGLSSTSKFARVSSAGRVESVSSFSAGDYPVGAIDGTSYLTLAIGAGASLYGSPSYTVTSIKTGTYTAAIGETVRCNPSGGGFTVNLPTAVGNGGRTITVKNVTSSTNAITLDGNSAETIDGSATHAIAEAYGARTLVSDGTNWMIV